MTQKPSIWRFSAIGTDWAVETALPLDSILKEKITNYIDLFDRTYSRFRDDSLVTQIGRSAGTYTFPQSAVEIFGLYTQLHEVTGGKVTPLVGSLLESLGYDAHYSLKEKSERADVPSLDVLQWQGTVLTVQQPVLIDIGALGKGFLVDRIAELLNEQHASYTIDASGDILVKGSKAERIGLEDPFEAGRVIGAVTVRNASLCGSATNRRRWGEDLHHIVDPDTGISTRGIAATWVRAKTTMLADGLATALFFTKPEILRQQFHFDFICFNDNRSMQYSESIGDITV